MHAGHIAERITRALGVAACLAGLAIGGLRAAPGELGHPVMRRYAPGEHLSAVNNPFVTQDAAGVMYISGGGNLITYDGARWGSVVLPTESAGVRQFARTDEGTVYLAGAGAIGYLRSTGAAAEYVSLIDRLPAGAANVDNLRYVAASGRTVAFSDDEKILIWRDERFTVVPFPAPPRTYGARLHAVNGAIYVTAAGFGLGRLTDEAVVRVSDDVRLRENQIIAIAPEADGALGLLTATQGFFRLEKDGRLAPWLPEARRWLEGRQVFRALRLGDGSWVVSFSAASGDGGICFAPDGRYLWPLDTTIGLLLKMVRGFFSDDEGGLWIGLEAGVTRLEWPSAVTVFDIANGLGQGAVMDVKRQDGTLYAATSEGFFQLVPADEAAGRPARFERRRGRPFYALAPHPGGLLALGNSELFVYAAQELRPVLPVPPGGGSLLRSTREPDLVWIGTTHGLQAVRHTAQGWVPEAPAPAFTEHCREMSEAADGSLWITTPERGLFRLTWTEGRSAAPRIERYTGGRGLPEPLAQIALVPGGADPRFVPNAEPVMRRHDARTNSFLPVEGPALPATEEGFRAFATGAGATQWVASRSAIYQLPGEGRPARALPHLVIATVGLVTRLWEERSPEGGVLWVGGESGLARIVVADAFPAPVPFATRLSATNVQAGAELPPQPATIKFRYHAPRQRHTSTVVYQTRLVGLDRDWSEWSGQRERSFANLPAGRYRFEARGRDPDGVLSAPVEMGFTVLAPWWLTRWAMLGYILAGLGLFGGGVHLRTRALRRHAARLEAIVAQRTRELAERTAELAQQNTELVRLNRLELDEKTAARLGEERARLEMLRYQLNPHFLFNTLTSISATLGAERSTARAMVDRLTNFCRLTLHRSNDRDWTTLGEEMQLLRTYLEIEQSRWGELLEVTVECAPGLAGEPLPHFLLLPLVENALKYGHATSVDRVGVRLVARREPGGALVLEVANTGEWVETEDRKDVPSLGIGLENLRERLRRHYPRAHTFEIVRANGWVTVRLRIQPGLLQSESIHAADPVD